MNFEPKSIYNSGSQPGVRVPLGVRAKVTGGTQKLKKCSKEAILGRIFDLGVREGHIILILGYTEGTILIWGYAGTKRLRTPDLELSFYRKFTVLPVNYFYRFTSKFTFLPVNLPF